MTLTSPATTTWAGPRHSIDTIRDGWGAWVAGVANSFAWGTANRAIYVPLRVPRACVVRQLAYANNTTATGNVDVGLYNAAGARLVSAGSTAKSATAGFIAIDITDTTIQAGLYYLALNNDTTTDTFLGDLPTAPFPVVRGVLTQAVGAVTLPSTATWAFDHTLAVVPQISALLVTEVT